MLFVESLRGIGLGLVGFKDGYNVAEIIESVRWSPIFCLENFLSKVIKQMNAEMEKYLWPSLFYFENRNNILLFGKRTSNDKPCFCNSQ